MSLFQDLDTRAKVCLPLLEDLLVVRGTYQIGHQRLHHGGDDTTWTAAGEKIVEQGYRYEEKKHAAAV